LKHRELHPSSVDEPKFMVDCSTQSPRDGNSTYSKIRPTVLVLSVTADLMVDDLSRLMGESDSVNVTRFWRYARQRWWKTSYIIVASLNNILLSA